MSFNKWPSWSKVKLGKSPDRPTPLLPVTEPVLGAFVFEKKCENWSRVGFLFGMGMVGVALFFLFATLTASDGAVEASRSSIVVAIFLIVGTGIAWLSKELTPKLCFHENGVVYVKRKLKQSLPFDQIEAITYDALVTKVNLGYSHTTLKLRFEPIDKSFPAISAKMIYKARESDNNFETLKSNVANRIADRMQARLRNGEPIVWSSWRSTLIFHPQGLEIRNAKSSEPGTIVPFEQISGYNFVDGVLHLFSERLPKPVALGTSTRNFYPGWYLLFRMAKIPEAPKKLWEKVLRIR